MKKQKGFTLVEILLVVLILVLIMWTGMNYFTTLEADRSYSESCMNSVYGNLSEWVYYASTSKILSGEIVPEKYVITVEGISGYVLKYQDSDDNEYFYYTGFLESIDYCKKSGKYENIISGSFSRIEMLPSLLTRGNENGFEIISLGGDKEATGYIDVLFCGKTDGSFDRSLCEEFGQIFFDSRVGMVKKKFCRGYEEDGKTCKIWNTGK